MLSRDRDDPWIQRTFFGVDPSTRANDCLEYCQHCHDDSCSGECLEEYCECGNRKERLSTVTSKLLRSLRSTDNGSEPLPLEAIGAKALAVPELPRHREAD